MRKKRVSRQVHKSGKKILIPGGKGRKPRVQLAIGGPPFKPSRKDRETAALLSSIGVPHRSIARVIGISVVTLRNHFKDELEDGKEQVRSGLVKNLVRLSKGSDATALRATTFLLQTKFGFSTTPRPEAPKKDEDGNLVPVGDDGKPLGKKEQANLTAQSAHKDTSWGDLISDDSRAN